jgi:hypothetical protein
MHPILSNDRSEDLMKWAKILKAVGYVLSVMGSRNDQDQAFEFHGEQIGWIIEDYAEAIYQTAEEARLPIQAFFEAKTSQENARASVTRQSESEAQEQAPEGTREEETLSETVAGCKCGDKTHRMN